MVVLTRGLAPALAVALAALALALVASSAAAMSVEHAASADHILARHYAARAALDADVEQELEAHSASAYEAPRASDAEHDARHDQAHADGDDEAEADEADGAAADEEGDAPTTGMARAPAPPSPPYASVMLQIEEQIANAEKAAAAAESAARARARARAATAAVTNAATASTATSTAKAAVKGGQRVAMDARASADAAQRMRLRGQVRTAGQGQGQGQGEATARSKVRLAARAKAKAKTRDPFPDQEFTYKDVSSPPDWLVPEKSEPAGPTTKPPPVPQMIPPPPPVPFPTYNYRDPNSAGPFSQFAPGVQGWGYDGGYAGPYDGYSQTGYPMNEAQAHGWGHPAIPRTAAQIAAATAASQYHPWGAPPPLYSLERPPPDGAASWVPLGAYLKPGTLEGGAGEDE